MLTGDASLYKTINKLKYCSLNLSLQAEDGRWAVLYLETMTIAAVIKILYIHHTLLYNYM